MRREEDSGWEQQVRDAVKTLLLQRASLDGLDRPGVWNVVLLGGNVLLEVTEESLLTFEFIKGVDFEKYLEDCIEV